MSLLRTLERINSSPALVGKGVAQALRRITKSGITDTQPSCLIKSAIPMHTSINLDQHSFNSSKQKAMRSTSLLIKDTAAVLSTSMTTCKRLISYIKETTAPRNIVMNRKRAWFACNVEILLISYFIGQTQ
jgi:hypothetical protein